MSAPAAACRACGSATPRTFYELAGIPVHSNRLLADAATARREPRGDLALAVCPACGFIANVRFDPALCDYRVSYEDSQAHSARFRAFADEILAGLDARHGLAERSVLEIGCGRGDFLVQLGGRAREAVGYDPSFRESEVSRGAPSGIRFVAEEYGPAQAGLAADLVFCRHTLEHVPQPLEFLRMVRRNVENPEAVLYFEVPDSERILREGAFWDVYYEHCSYFTSGSLRALFERCGFEVLRLERGYGEQYLMLEARPGRAAEPSTEATEYALADAFAARVAEARDVWGQRIATWRETGQRIALWGAGSKAAGFCTALGLGAEVACIVDINPKKQKHHQPGVGAEIVAPEALADHDVDVVIAMNPIYRDEIQRDLDRMDLHARLLTL